MSLFLNNNKIIDVFPLANIQTLKFLYLGDNRIVNISALSSCRFLKYLSQSNNNIVDFSAILLEILDFLTQVEYLKFDDN